MAIVRKKWTRFPQSSDRLLDVNLRALCNVLARSEITYVYDLKMHLPQSERGRIVLKRVRVYGHYNPDTGAIKIRVYKEPSREITVQEQIKLIVKTALHEALEKLCYGKMALRHKHLYNWEFCIFERMTESQMSYVWSLLPPLPES